MSCNIVNQDGSLTPVAGSINTSVVETTYADYKAMEENGTLRQDVAYYIKDEQINGNIPAFTNIDESLENITGSYFTLSYDENRNVVLNGTATYGCSWGAPSTSGSKSTSWNWNKLTAHIGDKYTIRFQHISGTASITPKFHLNIWNGYAGQSASPTYYEAIGTENDNDFTYSFTVSEDPISTYSGFTEGAVFVIEPRIDIEKNTVLTDYAFRWWIEKCEPQNMSQFCSPKQANSEISKKTYITDIKDSDTAVKVTLPQKNSNGILVVEFNNSGTMQSFLYSIRGGSNITPIDGLFMPNSTSANVAKEGRVTVSISSGVVTVNFVLGTGGYAYFIGM